MMDENKLVFVNTLLSKEMADKLIAISKAEIQSRSEIIRRAIEYWVQNYYEFHTEAEQILIATPRNGKE